MQSKNSFDKLNTGKGHERGAFQRSRSDMNPAQSYAPGIEKLWTNSSESQSVYKVTSI